MTEHSVYITLGSSMPGMIMNTWFCQDVTFPPPLGTYVHANLPVVIYLRLNASYILIIVVLNSSSELTTFQLKSS